MNIAGNHKEDLTQYSDDELSLHVFNCEVLYRLRNHPDALAEAIDNLFIFTDEQLIVLLKDIDEDAEHIAAEKRECSHPNLISIHDECGDYYHCPDCDFHQVG